MQGGFDRRKTLQELERSDWGEPDHPSTLVQTCHRLRRKPLADFDVEDLRIMIGQRIGLPFLVILAVEVLETDPLAEGRYFPGDLLRAVVRLPTEFWESHADSRGRVHGIIDQVRLRMPGLAEPDRHHVSDLLREASAALL